MRPRPAPAYLAGYPPHLPQQGLPLIGQGRVAAALLRRYPQAPPRRPGRRRSM